MALDGRIISNVGVLAAIVESGSFTRAADALGLSRSGVSRAVARLEAQLGIRLLDRTTRAVALTDEGHRFYAEITPLLTGIEGAVATASGAAVTVQGRLRVNVDAFFSRLLFAPHVAEFLTLHPGLSLELVARDRLGDLVGEGFDIAVRFGTPPESSLVARKLLETRTITVAAPTYLKRHGVPQTPEALSRHACIQVRDSLSGRPIDEWTFRQKSRSVRVQTSGRLLVAEFGTMLAACLDGVGIARVKAIGVEDLIRQGGLVEVLPDWHGERFALHALYPSRHLPPAKVRAFIDFVLARLTRDALTTAPRAAHRRTPLPSAASLALARTRVA
jgi:DNA-binding transcriptional LysR family regulator